MAINKRGVSGVVTAVLLILLTIAAIGILWVVVQNFVSTSTEGVGESAACLSTQFEIAGVSYTGTTLTVNVTRLAGDSAVDSLKFIADGKPITMTSVTVPGVGETTPYTNTAVATKPAIVEIAAVISGTTCGVADSATVP